MTERRPDGLLDFEPTQERLSDVIRETDGKVPREGKLVAHLERVAAKVDDLPVGR